MPALGSARLALAVLALGLAASAARADTFAGGDWTTGAGYRGFDAKAGLDLDAAKTWEGDATYSYAHSYSNGTESRSRQLTLTGVHVLDAAWTSRFGVTGWRDSLNDVDYLGPSYGFTYLALEDPAAKDSAERWGFSLDNDLFVYKADETTVARRIVVARRVVTIPGGQSAVTLAQWHPYAHFEVPVVDETFVPSVDYGHYFYSKDPALIEARAGRPRFASSASSLSGLVGGLNSDEATAGLLARLPGRVKLTVSLGATRSATDGSWATTQGAGASVFLGDHVKAAASWARTIQAGAPQDLYTAGLTLFL